MPLSKLKVISFCSYLTNVDVVWGNNNYRAMNAVRLLKGEEPSRDLYIKIEGKRTAFNLSNCDEFIDNSIAKLMSLSIAERFTLPVTLVPVPGSKIISVASPNFRTLRLASSIANHMGPECTTTPALVFKKEMNSSRKGGPRDPYVLNSEMRLTEVPKGPTLIVDDVYTTGAHFKASLWKLEDAGVNVIGAIAFAQSTKVQSDKVFYDREEEFDCERMMKDDDWWE